jgi:putative ABC transport system permease protein
VSPAAAVVAVQVAAAAAAVQAAEEDAVAPRMQIGETVSVALEALRANKLRSFLTMLGIVIGVGAVIAMVALGRGAQESVKDRIASLGTTLLTVMPSQSRGTGGVASSSDRAPLTMDDAKAIEDRSTFVAAVQPEMSRSLQVQYENKNTNTSIVGTRRSSRPWQRPATSC